MKRTDFAATKIALTCCLTLAASWLSFCSAGAQSGEGQPGQNLQNQPATAAPAPKAVFLQGGAEHLERLPSVEPQLQAGAVFNAASLPEAQSNNQWYWIPSWYAGQKHVDSETIVQDYNFQTGQNINPNRTVTNRQDLAIGFQADRNGQIWEFNRAPYTTTVEGDGFFTTMIVRKRDPVSVSQNQVVIRLLQTSINVDSRTKRILQTLQEEQINTYVPASEGVMNMQTSIKSFAADGSPLVQETSNRVVYNRAAFTPVNNYQGRDMRALFKAFMLSHGYANLLPDELQEQKTAESGDNAAPVEAQTMPAAAPDFRGKSP